MKSLILVCLFVAATLAAPRPSPNQQQQQQQQQNRRRLQSLNVQLVDDDEDDKGRFEYRGREERRHDRDRYDDDRDRYDHDQDRYNDERDRYDDDRDRDDDGDDDDDDDRKDSRRDLEYYRFDDEDDTSNSLRSTHLDSLAQQMDIVASKYGSQGRVKVAYIPPTQKGNPYSHDLGSLNFKYIPSRNRELQIQSVKPVLYIRPDDKSGSEYDLSSLTYNPFLAAQLRKQQRQKQRDRDDDDSQE